MKKVIQKLNETTLQEASSYLVYKTNNFFFKMKNDKHHRNHMLGLTGISILKEAKARF